MSPRFLRLLVSVVLILVTAVSAALVTFRLTLDPNVASLLPAEGEAAALGRYVRGFGGGDLAVVLLTGDDPEELERAADEAAAALSAQPRIELAVARLDVDRSIDPMLAFRHADPQAQRRLAEALTEEGMRERLEESRKLLLAPGASSASEMIREDPLRLAQLVFEQPDIGSGVRTQPDGAFATDDGRARLVLLKPQGIALRGDDARALVSDVEQALAPIRAEHPDVELGLTGGHAIAAATEAMLRRDLSLSSTVSLVLASLAFFVVFRRLRALVAVMPPLMLGTLWTASLATVFPGGLSAIAVAFMSVVVGVGVDTGIHVYAALLEARRAGHAPAEAARIARRETVRPVLVAASAAGAAFATLALSEIDAIVQLGVLCAAGEILTALAIVVVTPEIAAWLERRSIGKPAPSGWTAAFDAMTRGRSRAAVALGVALVPLALLFVIGPPRLSDSLVAVRPEALVPLQVQHKVFDAFGGKQGQWVVLVADPDLGRARTRADRVAERLSAMDGDVEAVDALTALAPAPATQADRFAQRDALDPPLAARRLERALEDVGFAPEQFEEALARMRDPTRQQVELDALADTSAAILLSRYLGRDGDDHLVALYLRPTDEPGAQDRIESAIRETDAEAMLTGYARLEVLLRESLSRDLPKIGGLAAVLVILMLSASLRRARDVLLASAVVVVEIALVLLLVRVFDVPLHAYDVLVLPVLLGITVDEAMFLLYRARREGDEVAATLRAEGPPIAATALTTASGFGALMICDFDGLSDLGAVGALGSVTGLLVALIVVPAGLRLLRARPPQESPARHEV